MYTAETRSCSVWFPRLLLDEGRQGDDLPHAALLQRGVTSEILTEGQTKLRDHRLYKVHCRRVPRERIRLGKQITLEIWRIRVQVSNQLDPLGRLDEPLGFAESPGLEDVCHLSDHQSFRERDRAEVDLTGCKFFDDLQW